MPNYAIIILLMTFQRDFDGLVNRSKILEIGMKDAPPAGFCAILNAIVYKKGEILYV